MARHPLESSWHKYRWAKHHSNAVNTELSRVFDANKDILGFDVEIDQRGDEATAVARISRLPIIHERCALRLGDAIQNYRAALDHLAWNLVRIGQTPNPKQPQRIQFPMAKSRQHFETSEKPRCIPGVAKDQVAVLRRYQPYRRGVNGAAIRRLQRLSNMDKHRVLIPGVVTPAPSAILTTSNWRHVGPPEYLIGNRRALKVNTKVMQTELVRADASDCQVSVDGNLSIYPSLGRGLHILEALMQIDKAIFAILEGIEETL